MIRTYLFACHEHIEDLRTFVVNVALPHNALDAGTARASALAMAQQVAEEKGLQAPALMAEDGVADIQLVVEKGEVVATFFRNTQIPPAVTVFDLDYENDGEKANRKFMARMKLEGYERIPHLMVD